MNSEIFNEKNLKEKIQKSIEALKTNLASVRTGRANPAFLENVHVEVYGSSMSLKQVATISVDTNSSLKVTPFDKGSAKDIYAGIRDAGLGINPIQDGGDIRVPLPQMTEERRKELQKVVQKYGEDTKVAIRNIRRDTNDDLKKANKDKQISDDELKRYATSVDKIVDASTAEIDSLVTKKSKELMEV
jgi:ribosome recycling factor